MPPSIYYAMLRCFFAAIIAYYFRVVIAYAAAAFADAAIAHFLRAAPQRHSLYFTFAITPLCYAHYLPLLTTRATARRDGLMPARAFRAIIMPRRCRYRCAAADAYAPSSLRLFLRYATRYAMPADCRLLCRHTTSLMPPPLFARPLPIRYCRMPRRCRRERAI